MLEIGSGVMPIGTSRTPQKVQAGKRTVRMTARVRAAVEAMVWQGLKRDVAAKVAGMKDNSLYVALRKADVRLFYLAECELLRLSGRARRIHRLEAVVEQDENKMAIVQAARALDGMTDERHATPGAAQTPGFVIVIHPAADRPCAIDVTSAASVPAVDR